MSSETLFNDQLQMLEGIFNGKDGVWLVIRGRDYAHSIVVDKENVELVKSDDWWRERNEESGMCYFRRNWPWEGIPRPELHRIIAGIADTKIRVSFNNGCCFDLRRANLTPSAFEKKKTDDAK